MAKTDTLKDLSDFLNQNPNEIQFETINSKEDYLKQQPNAIVKAEEKTITLSSLNQNLNYKNITSKEIAKILHQRAKDQKRSFAELWMEVVEEGAKIDPLLKNTSILQTIRTINKTTMNVALEGIAQFIKSK
jgi:hypothetical protein